MKNVYQVMKKENLDVEMKVENISTIIPNKDPSVQPDAVNKI